MSSGNGEVTSNINKTAVAGSVPPAGGASKVPEWFQAELFENVLKENVTDYKRTVNFKAFPALGAGENYATLMLRTEIDVELKDGRTKSISYMCKVPIHNPIFVEMMKKHNMFHSESLMYNVVVPEFEKLYKDAGVEVKFGAQFHRLPIETDHICLEDLRQRGFKNANRLEGLDLDHVHCVLKKLAQWHAASAVRVAITGQYPEILTTGIFTEAHRVMFEQINNTMSQTFRKCLTLFEGHEQYEESVEKLQHNLTEMQFKVGHVDPTEFNVLNHGDLWCNNIMFQYDAFGKIKETYFVDYQVPKYGTPAQDLLYFLISSTKLELKLKRFEYFIKFYHDHLIENLKVLKYSKALPALKDIHAQIYKYGLWGFATASGVMAAVLLDPNENANVDNFLSDSADGQDFKMLMYSNPRYRQHIEVILPWLHNRGALEC